MSFETVPWRTAEEWKTVYSNIYGPESTIKSKRCAVESMLMWKIRSSELPVGIESTLTLLEVELKYKESTQIITDDNFLRLAYSSAIMRFINHTLDSEISKGFSLYEAARNKEVDQWIVDLRHDTAHHSTIPPLKLLLKATKRAMGWLMQHYWEPHNQVIADYVVQAVPELKVQNFTNQEYINRLTHFYINLSVCSSIKAKNINDIKDSEMRKSLIEDGLSLNETIISKNIILKKPISEIIKVIQKMIRRAVKITESGDQMSVDAILGEDSPFMSLELFEHYHSSRKTFEVDELDKTYMHMWEPLLQFLHRYNLLPKLVEQLVLLSVNDQSERSRLAALWVKELLHALKKCNLFKKYMKKLKKQLKPTTSPETIIHNEEVMALFYHHYPNEKNRLTLNLQLKRPIPKEYTSIIYIKNLIKTLNPYLHLFITQLLELLKPLVSSDQIKKMLKLSEIVVSNNLYQMSLNECKIYTVNDIKIDDPLIDDLLKESPLDVLQKSDDSSDCMIVDDDDDTYEPVTAGAWTLAACKVDWSECPFGVIPQTIIDNGPWK